MNIWHCTSATNIYDAQGRAWPDFPLPLNEAVGARLGNVLFAGLGSAGQAWLALDITATPRLWRLCAEFPFGTRNGAAIAAANGKIYVFGGSGRSSETKTLHQFDSIACYDPQSDRWTELSARLPTGTLGASAVAMGTSIYIFGGYNKPQFDRFFDEYENADQHRQSAILHGFMDRKAEDFAWNEHVWKFDTRNHSWHDLGKVPHAPTCGSGVIADGGEVMLASGEIKPGLRTASVQQVSIQDGELTWRDKKDLPALGLRQEGLAAAFSGQCGRVKIIAGGTNFLGAMDSYLAGKKYAHQGLRKIWRDEVYMLEDENWKLAARLPRGRATGLAFEVDQGLLLVGGDTQDGRPFAESWLLAYTEGTGVTISGNKPN